MTKKSSKNGGRTSDAGAILDRMAGDDAALHRMVEEARNQAKVAQLIYDVRAKAKLTQKELADLVGTTQSVIARLEDADYEGHSLAMLGRIAAALERRVEIRFVRQPRTKEIYDEPSMAGSH